MTPPDLPSASRSGSDSWPDLAAGPAGPSRKDVFVFGSLLAVLLALLALIESQRGGTAPVAFVISGLILYAVLCLARLEAAFLVLLAVTPFSVEMVLRGSGSALQIPTEPMLFLALVIWGLRFLILGSTSFRQPVLTGALVLALVSCVLSIHDTAFPVNAMKATANGLWYGLFGVFLWNNFRDKRELDLLILAWLVPGAVICLYSLFRVLMGDFSAQAGYWSAAPFFTEHGTFAAYLSFVFMLALALFLELKGGLKVILGFVALLSGAQVILSLTRGAWMGLAAGIVFLAIVSGRRLFTAGNLVLTTLGCVILAGVLMGTGAVRGIDKQAQNITDPAYVSNLERVNRWYAGWNMFRNDPATGVGFGTYADNYAANRRIPLGTEQSTSHMGVHSEYLRILSETGLAGAAAAFISFVVLAGIGWRAIRGARDPVLRGLAVGMAGGLVTYLVHGTVNNFLIYDKAAIPVWTAIGVLGAIESLKRA